MSKFSTGSTLTQKENGEAAGGRDSVSRNEAVQDAEKWILASRGMPPSDDHLQHD